MPRERRKGYWQRENRLQGGHERQRDKGREGAYPERASQVVKEEIISTGPSESMIVE